MVTDHRAEAGGTTGSSASGEAGAHGSDPRAGPAVTFVTTEHFTLQGARAATTAESTGRATMFLGSVSAGLVALGLIATATRIGTAFYAFGLILLSTLWFVSFDLPARAPVRDRRPRLCRTYRAAKGLLLRLRARTRPLPGQRPASAATGHPGPAGGLLAGLPDRRRNGWRRYSGTVAGSAAGLLTAIADGHSGVAGFVAGGIVGAAILVALMEFQFRRFRSVFGAGQSGPGTD